MVQHQYNGIYLVGRSRIKGSLGLDDQSIRWKAQYVSKSVNVAADEVMDLHWAQVGQQYQVKIVLQSGAHVRFQGFLKKDFEVFEAFSKSAIGKSMELVDYATNGWNWGNFDFKCKIILQSIYSLFFF